VTTLPTWAVWVLAFGVPLLSFVGVVVGVAITRRGDTELEKRSRREEVMRSLRWAAQLAVEGDEAKAELGVAHLRALGKSDILDSDGQRFIDAALAAVVSEPVRARQAGANLVVGVSTTASGTVSGVASGQDQSDEKGGFGGN
jgi:hypothetical protein